ncbi:MAG: M81 family metallopeptidase [Paracoccus sp. (in: a-proteobacteria)]
MLVAAEFDPHSHLTAKRVANLDLMAAFLEFPHTDFEERGEHVVDLALRTLRGEIRPVISTFDCRMITIYPTSREPMRGFVDRLKALEGQGGVLSISVIHGFMAGDVPDMGTRIVTVTDGGRAGARRWPAAWATSFMSCAATPRCRCSAPKAGLTARWRCGRRTPRGRW